MVVVVGAEHSDRDLTCDALFVQEEERGGPPPVSRWSRQRDSDDVLLGRLQQGATPPVGGATPAQEPGTSRPSESFFVDCFVLRSYFWDIFWCAWLIFCLQAFLLALNIQTADWQQVCLIDIFSSVCCISVLSLLYLSVWLGQQEHHHLPTPVNIIAIITTPQLWWQKLHYTTSVNVYR